MKHTALIPLVAAAAATAFVVPDEATARELVVETERKAGATISSWWDRVPSPEDVRAGAKDAFDEAKRLEARWKEVEREQRELYQVRPTSHPRRTPV